MARWLETLTEIRRHAGKKQTIGLNDEVVEHFANTDPTLVAAIEEASHVWHRLRTKYDALLSGDEGGMIERLQAGYLNFYDKAGVNPYVPLSARGPWVVTTHGAVVYDCGSYGMLGFGHAPDFARSAVSEKQVMANVMTASFSQAEFLDLLNKEIGANRTGTGGRPFTRYVCLNSGSEAMTFSSRLSDVNAKTQIEGKHKGKKVKFLALEGSFHGRTDRPAQFSGSTLKSYEVLASFSPDKVIQVEPNNVSALRQAFQNAERDGVFIESVSLEPVMGEGDPGRACTREFYDEARRLTLANDAILIIDSIQAGLRACGHLSIVDYPGFETCEPPDLEAYSKALNAGQFPLSVVAMTERAASLYRKGIYGNTMTTNPRALDVASAVLTSVTPKLRRNIVERGQEAVTRLKSLQERSRGLITRVEGTGLLFAAHIDGQRVKVVGHGGIEEYLRFRGIGVIHGGENALRFTPPFTITSDALGLIVDEVGAALKALA